MAAKFHHAGIVVPQLEAGARFYSSLLGLEEAMRFQWEKDNDRIAGIINLAGSAARLVMLQGDGFRVEIFEYAAPPPTGRPADLRPCDPGIRHVAFEFDDLPAACRTFVDLGGSLHRDPSDLDGVTAIYGRDPFGNIVELIQAGTH
jgi:catechol 2,3-dioxygenase-like lactoylglutathione lyase family enzyme